MSAIAGIWRFDGRPDADDACQLMINAQAALGPGGAEMWRGGSVALGRAIYRTLPEDRFDLRPPASAGHVLAADLRLDNREELLRELGKSARDEICDADLLLAAWDRWAERCLDKLVGDYAFAVWDRRAERLVLARDILGRRPLHYHLAERFIAFATMPRGLHALADIPYAPDEQRLAMHIALLPGRVVGSRSFFRGIERVEPGCLVVIEPQKATRRRYWSPQPHTTRLKSPEDYAEALRSHLDTAVRAQLRGAEKHVGAQLSGGWDSAAVAATAARQMAAGGGQVTAFTAAPRLGFTGPVPAGKLGDESELAAATVALYPNMAHVIVRSTGQSAVDAMDRDFFSLEEPFFNPSNGVWTRAINGEARARGLSVVLSGGHGNASLTDAGWDRLPGLVAGGHLVRWLMEGDALVRNRAANWRGVLGRSLGPWIPAGLWSAYDRLRGRRRVDTSTFTAINPALMSQVRDWARAAEFDLAFRPNPDPMQARLRVAEDADELGYLKGWLAESGIDLRDPTSDRRLVEFSLGVPPEQLLRDGKPRALGRLALSDRVPAQVLDETRQGLQAADWFESMTASREEIAREIGRWDASGAPGRLMNLPRLQALVDDWPRDGWARPEVIESYSLALERALAVGHFLRRASRSNK